MFTTKICRQHKEVMVIFRTRYITDDPDLKVAITGAGGHLGSWGQTSALRATEVPRYSSQWIAVCMVPVNSIMEFQCVVVDNEDKIVDWESAGINRQLAIKENHLHVSLPWALPNVMFFRKQPPSNLGKKKLCFKYYFIQNVKSVGE